MKTRRLFEFDFQERGCTFVNGMKLKYVPNLIPHDYMCPCEQCKGMAAAIMAQNPDGSYFYSEEELKQMASRWSGK